MPDCKTLLNQIRALDFALLETGLYLNAYPCEEEAIAYFETTRTARDAAVAEYERHYGPLKMASGVHDNKWVWTKGPWPWECEAN